MLGLLVVLLSIAAVGCPKQLVAVQLIHRHGIRTPLLRLPDSYKIDWDCELRMLHHTSDGRMPFDRLFEKEYADGQQVLNGNCKTGQLRKVGFDLMVDLGRRVRQRYAPILPEDYDPALVWLETDEEERCIHSIQGVYRGLFPDSRQRVVPLHFRDRNVQGIGHQYDCPNLWNTQIAIEESDLFKQHNNSKESQELYARMQDLLCDGQPCQLPPLHRIFAQIEARRLNGIFIPEALNDDDYRRLKDENDWYHNHIFKTNVTMHNLVSALFLNVSRGFIMDSVEGRTSRVLYVFSSHDTNIMGLLGAFELYDQLDDPAVPIGADFHIQLLRGSENDYYIKILYLGRELRIPRECGDVVECPLDKWLEMMDRIIPDDWVAACGL